MSALRREIRTPVGLLVLGIVVVSLASLLVPSSATYDPWSWIVWGREIVHGDLQTTAGPSWKPLPVVVTTLAAPLGADAAPYVWVAAARMGALAGVAVAFFLGRRLGGTAAGVAAAVPLLLAPWTLRNGWLANSEGLLVAVVLGAVLAEATGRRRWAFACAMAAGWLRPEAWPFLLLYAAFLALRTDTRGRVGLVAALATLPVVWLVPEKIGSGDWWRAASRAQNPDAGAASFADHPALKVTGNLAAMMPTAFWAALVVAALGAVAVLVRGRGAGRPDGPVAPDAPGTPSPAGAAAAAAPPQGARGARARVVAWVRADRVLAGTIALGLAWLAVVAVLTERGFSGNERYLIPPAALLLVSVAALAGRAWSRFPEAGRVAVAAVFVVVVVVGGARRVPHEMREVTYESRLVHDLPAALAKAGGTRAVLGCGPVFTNRFYVPQAAWRLDVHTASIGIAPTGTRMTLLRVRTGKGDPIRPIEPDVPGLRTIARTEFWQVQSTCAPGSAR